MNVAFQTTGDDLQLADGAVTRPLRILMTVDAVGGVWRYAMGLAEALRPMGVTTVFAGLGPRPTAVQKGEAESLGELVWLDQPLDWIVADEQDLAGVAPALDSVVDDREIDVLHLNLPTQARGLRTGRPVLVVSHSCVVTWWATMRKEALPARWLWQKQANSEGFARADAVVAPSRSHATMLARCYGDLPGLTVVHNGARLLPIERRKKPFVFAAGRWWDEGKNAVALDTAAAASPWPVRLAGSTLGPNGERIDLHSAEHLGELAHSELLDHMRRASIVSSPSLYEPFGLAALEGALSGAALVLSDIPTYRELWSDAALFFDPHDTRALSTEMRRLMDDPLLRAEMAARAFARSRSYSLYGQAGAMMSLYRMLAGVSEPAARQV
jgi:glycosyltransferase involved in cell wall biosynthesis